jgi:beta-galactosidase
MRFIYLFLILVLFNLAAVAQLSPRKKINFDDNWKFHLGHAADANKDFNYTIVNIFSKTGKGEGTPIDPHFKDKAWRTIQLPHDWAIELPFENSDNADVMAHGYRPVGGLYPQNSVGYHSV